MTYAIRSRQSRCAALGFWPGPIDGLDGKRTQTAYAAAVASQRAKGLPFAGPVTRVHWHWTAGGHAANATDRRAYHCLIEGTGFVIWLADPTEYRPHTLNANSGAVSISLCAMAGAVERPFNAGKYPVLPPQLHALARETAKLCLRYDIPVSRWSTLSHAEVQPSLGISQRQKWDITYLPGMGGTADPITVGDRIRDMVRAQIETMK